MENKTYTLIELNDEELQEAIRIGTERDRLNKLNGIGHNQSFHRRAEAMGDDRGSYFHQKGCIGEAAVYKYFTNISEFFDLPKPERTGWGAWTPEERAAHFLDPDIEWLGREVEVKTAETYKQFGITRKLVNKERALIVVVPELARPADYDNNNQQWTNKVTICGVVELAEVKPQEVWNKLTIPFYDKTGGKECRTMPFSDLTLARVWARNQVDQYTNTSIQVA